MTTAIPTISGVTTDAGKTANQRVTLANDFNDFLRLLTTQLQNQDPLSPMDSNEFTNQLVQFSQVEQQINSNQKLDNLVALNLSSAVSMAIGYVGLDASYVSADLNYDGTNPVKINYSTDAPVRSGKLRIVKEDGTQVFEQDISGKSGKNEIIWNGKDSEGNPMTKGTYTVKPVKSTIVVEGRVRGLETQDGQIFLLVGERAVPLANVLNASVPEEETPPPSTST
jgi:flagellar basal-body rod modification protein FlgD